MTGERIGIYEIVRVLARGGTGVVYLARQAALDREVALKRLDLDSGPLLAQRFVREAQFAAALDHPNVVTVFDFFEHDGVPYIAMEYVAGGSLRPFVGRLALPQVARVLEGVLTGLAHAEERGVAHRDLKPENVLLTRRGAVKIADFGIARAYNAVTAQLTSTGSAIGTPAYMAPEQAQNERLGPYTDMYAVGVIAYELLAGRPPFEGSTPVAVLYQHVHTPPPPLAEVAPDTPPRVREWVDWLLAKDPLARPASATDAWEALEEMAVDGLGPYWRRAGAITAPVAPEAPPVPDVPADEQPTTADSPPEGRTLVDSRERGEAPLEEAGGIPRRRIAAAVAVVATAGVLGLLLLRSDEPRSSSPPRAATPFDFDGDGREELVLGMPESASRGERIASGVVVVHGGPGSSESIVITPDDAGVPEPFTIHDRFGGGLASADFNRDGLADLAVGAPGRALVSVVYGTEDGLLGGRTEQIPGAALRLPAPAGRYGIGLAAADFNADGFGDLVIGAPGPLPVGAGSGVMKVVFGDASGLDVRGAQTLRPPDRTVGDFGNRIRAGDVNGDARLDVVAGAPDRLHQASTGHLVVCLGKRGGPDTCERLGETADGGTSSLGIADVDNDGYEDIVQGDGGGEPEDGGEVRLWFGGPEGPARRITIDQDTPDVAGRDEPGDGFGTIVDVGDTDPDGYADLLISAPYEDRDEGAVTLVRGAKRGWAAVGSIAWRKDPPDVPGVGRPGDRFGSALGVLQLTDDDELDVVVIAGGARRLGGAVTVIQGTPGAMAPSEALASPIERLAELVEPAGMEFLRIGRPGRQPSPQ
ncbi:MAG TPA: protein kinase [Solirubrobacteraceae bacterium]|nr:protein kinase [Solirubrobacteraceae bacterium]